MPSGVPQSADPQAEHRGRAVDPSVFVNEFTQDLPDPAVTFSGPGYYTPRTPTCGFATAALLAALAGVVLPPAALLAIVFGHIGTHRTSGRGRAGRGMAIGATVVGYAVLLFWTALLVTTWIVPG